MIKKRNLIPYMLASLLIVSMLLALPRSSVFAGYLVADSATLTTYSGPGWATMNDSAALFGSVQYTSNPGDSVSWTFNGDHVAYLYSMAFNRGSTIVTIDGTVVDILDSLVYHFPGSEVRRQVGKVYSLYSGQHTITITNGPVGANGRRYTDLDAFVSDIKAFLPGTYNDDASLWENGVLYHPLGTHGDGWTTVNDPNAYQGEYKMSSSTRSGFRINFQGDSIYWFFPRSRSDLGQASITIDGEDHGIYDPYSTGNNYTWWGGLGSGYHEMTITNTGHTSSSGTVLALDEFVVGTTSTYNRVMGSSYADGWAHSRNSFWFGDFSPNDCANFASQMLYKEGLSMHPADGQGIIQNDLTQWWNYFPYGDGVSYTWRLVPSFYTYATNRSEYHIQDNSGYTRRGDLMLLDGDNDGELDHMKAIVGNGYMSPYYSSDYYGQPDLSTTYTYGLMTDGHTNDRWHVPVCYSYNCDYLTWYIRIIP